MPSAESFDVQGTPYIHERDKIALINQITEELISGSPSFGYIVKFHTGNRMTVTYHCYEMALPQRIKIVDEQAAKLLGEWEKHVKKEFKARSGKALNVKELKELRDSNAEKVSLNDRYYFRASRTYEVKYDDMLGKRF